MEEQSSELLKALAKINLISFLIGFTVFLATEILYGIIAFGLSLPLIALLLYKDEIFV